MSTASSDPTPSTPADAPSSTAPSSTAEAPNPAASTAAQALAAAGDAESARDVGALDDAAFAAQKRLGKSKKGLVERLVYGPAPTIAELQSGTLVAREARSEMPVVKAALDCMARGEAFTADEGLSAALRKTVAEEKAYAYTVPVDFGGAGASYGELALTEEELAANGLGALAVEVSGELTIGAGSLIGYGTDSQKKTYLPMLAEGRLMGFALTEVGVGVNAKKVQAYVEPDPSTGGFRLNATGPRRKMYITNATHGALVGLVARIGKGGKKIGLFIIELPEADVTRGEGGSDFGFECRSTGVSAFVANHNSRLTFDNFPIPAENQIQADGVEVLFYCLRMGRCMLAAMSAGYQRMLAADAAHFARQRDGVGGRVIKHELPRLNFGRMLGGALQARALSHLSLKQDADGVDLAGLRDLTKSAASGTAMESQVACERVLGGRTFHKGTRASDARSNLHVFGIVEGEDDLILMGMIKDITAKFTDRYMAGMLGVIQSINVDGDGSPLPRERRILRIGLGTVLKEPKRCLLATLRLLTTPSFWMLKAWIVWNLLLEIVRLPGRLVPSSWIPRYQLLPSRLRGHARFAERKLRGRRWTYLWINLWFQLELTRAQVPLQRLGKSIEHLFSIVAVCNHAAKHDESQRRVAELQAQLLRDKFGAIRIVSALPTMDRMRTVIAEIGGDVERGSSTLLEGVEPAPFAQPWDEDGAGSGSARG